MWEQVVLEEQVVERVVLEAQMVEQVVLEAQTIEQVVLVLEARMVGRGFHVRVHGIAHWIRG